MTTTAPIVVRDLKRTAYLDLTQDEMRLLYRIVSLTKSGQKDCVYTNQQAQAELNFDRSKTSRVFKSLSNKGFVVTQRVTAAFGQNTRRVSLCVQKFFELRTSKLSAEASAMVNSVVSATTSVLTNPALSGSSSASLKVSVAPEASAVVIAPAVNGPVATTNCVVDSISKSAEAACTAVSDAMQHDAVACEQATSRPCEGATSHASLAEPLPAPMPAPAAAPTLAQAPACTTAQTCAQAPAPVAATAPAPACATGTGTAAGVGAPAVIVPAVPAAQLRDLSPAVTNTLQFDFTECMKKQGLLPLVAFGKQGDPYFDFSQLAAELSPSFVRECHFAYGWPEFCADWAVPFLVFSVLNEICFFQDEMFAHPEACPKYNLSALADFIKEQQRGLLFFVLRARYGIYYDTNSRGEEFSYTGKLLIRRIVGLYDPLKTKGDSPLPYIKRIIVRQCMEILADPNEFFKLLRPFMDVVRSNACCQLWATRLYLVDALRTRSDGLYEELLSLYYPTYSIPGRNSWYDLTRKSVYGCATAFPMRLSYPFMLLRKVGGLDHLACYERGDTASGDEFTRKINYDLGHCAEVKASFEQFVQRYGAHFPFLHQLAACDFSTI